MLIQQSKGETSMKRKLLTILLAVTVTATMSFAGISTVFADSGNTSVSGATGRLTSALSQKATTSDAAATPITIENGAVITPASANASSVTTYMTPTYSSGSPVLVYPIQAKKGGLSITFTGANCTAYSSLYSDSQCSNSVTYNSNSSDSSTGVKGHYYSIKTNGTYYLKFSLYSFSGSGAGVFAVQHAPSGGTLTNGKAMMGGSASKDSVSYYKVKVPATGYITLVMASPSDYSSTFRVKLTNSGKKTLFSGYESLNSSGSYTTRIGVKKGTYYIGVKSYNAVYAIGSKFTKVSCSKHGTSKSKAVTIKKGVTRKGVLAASSSASDWYKIRLTRSQAVSIAITAKSSAGGDIGGNIKFTIYNSSGSYTSDTLTGVSNNTMKPYTVGNGSKLTKGTYYIKVSRNHKGNGYYTLK